MFPRLSARLHSTLGDLIWARLCIYRTTHVVGTVLAVYNTESEARNASHTMFITFRRCFCLVETGLHTLSGQCCLRKDMEATRVAMRHCWRASFLCDVLLHPSVPLRPYIARARIMSASTTSTFLSNSIDVGGWQMWIALADLNTEQKVRVLGSAVPTRCLGDASTPHLS